MRYLVIEDGALRVEHGALKLDDLQRLVHGCIEPAFTVASATRPHHCLTGYVNEEFLYQPELTPNLVVNGALIMGPMVITGLDDSTGETCELTDAEVAQVMVCRTDAGHARLVVREPGAGNSADSADAAKDGLFATLQAAGCKPIPAGCGNLLCPASPKAFHIINSFAPILGALIDGPDGSPWFAVSQLA